MSTVPAAYIALRRHAARTVAAGAIALALAAGVPGVAGALLDMPLVEDYQVTCVYYTQTSGSCIASTYYDNGTSSHAFYLFWGNWYVQV